MKNTLRKNLGLALVALVAVGLPLYAFAMVAREHNSNIDKSMRLANYLSGKPESQIVEYEKTWSELRKDDLYIEVVKETDPKVLVEPVEASDVIDFSTAEGVRYRVLTPPLRVGNVFSYAVFPAGFLLLIAFMLAVYFSKRAEREDLQPAKDLMHYLMTLVSGNFDESIESPDFSKAYDRYFTDAQSKKEFVQAIGEIRENELLRRQFSANVSHELKSPLTSINGYAEMIESGMTSPEDSKRFAGIIHREGIRLLNMINETIQLSKFDTGYSDLDTRAEIDVAKLTLEEISSVSPIARDHNIRISFDGHSTTMHGNEKLIGDVIRNLISNAIKYSKPEGGLIDIKLIDDHDSLTWSIQDTGLGIEPGDQTRVFERFYVVDKARTRQTGSGTGLGLSLVKHTVESYGGTIHLQSKLGVGSLFTVRLPKRQAEKSA